MSEHRLPPTATPTAYRLHLQADPAKETFEGRVHIDVQATATDVVVLHAENLDVQEAHVLVAGQTIPAEHHTDGDRLTLTPARPLPAGPATIEIRYIGHVRQDMAGLYLSQDGDRTCLATQCEATDARSIVPCWDEPAYKATWAWTITAPRELTVLSNGAVRQRSEEGDHATHIFEPTPAMSSYLIACCIGDFASTEAIVARDTPFRVWSMSGQEQHGDAGNAMAAEMVAWYEDYFGQPYAFGKYDQIAVPSFAFGAMENAGLVLFRPSLVLLDEATASWDDKRHVALVVAHEFAHMWFGNLVTMAWWDDLWLNEAFAEWIAHKCAAAMDPSLEAWVPFRQRAAGALSTDAMSSTHAIYHPVQTPEEAQEMFDAITYGKGSAVMRMLESFLGRDAFQQGLQTYMAAFRFDNARGDDLWHHLGEASGQDVEAIMGDWVNQAGHPTIQLRTDGATLHLRQRRTKSTPATPDDDTLWRVPLVIRYAEGDTVHELRHLMTDREESIDLAAPPTWVWANADDGGFYRVALDDELLHAALAHVGALSPPEQVGLVRDLWMQVRSGDRPVTAFLEAVAGTVGDRHYEFVEFQIGVLRMLDGMLEGDAEQAAFRAWMAEALRPVWEDESDTSEPGRQRRAALLRGLGVAADPSTVATAHVLAAAERNHDDVDPQLASAAVSVEALNGDSETLRIFLDTYETRRNGHASPQEVERYLYALAAFRDPACSAQVLELLKGQGVAAQAEGPILRAMLASAHAGAVAWAHVKADWPELEGRLGEAWLGIIVEACGELPVELADDVIAFWDERLDGRAGQSYLRAKERLQDRAELEARIGDDLRAWAAGLVIQR